ncbi:MAG: hypothetical protein ACO3EP_11815, partial [Phycisphaerales bacterium]
MNRVEISSSFLLAALLLAAVVGSVVPQAAAVPQEAASAPSADASPTAEPPPALAPGAAPPTIDPATRAAWIREAQQWLESGDFAKAEPLLAEARAVSTDPRLAYNLGLCAFEAGRFGEAAMLFEEAALSPDASLAQRAMFNQGNARYREGVELVEAASAPQDGEATAPAEAIESLQQALVPLRAALKHFRDAVRSDREDRDARANAELTHRTIREIERTIDELERQEQQQNQQQQDQQDG